MEAIPFWAVLLALCGGIVTIISAIEKIVNAGKVINGPYTEHNRRIKALEERCDKFEQYFSRDNQRLADLEQTLSILLQAEFALLSHAINGNDVDKLKDVQSAMMEYLTKRGISV